MKTGAVQSNCTPRSGVQIGHNGGPDIEAERLFALIGPKMPDEPVVFDCGADWTLAANDDELVYVAKIAGRIQRREAAIKEMRRNIKRVRDRCIRRRRRQKGLD